MKPFDIEISEILKGPEELKLQLPIQAKVIQQIQGKDRPDYFIVELDESIIWIDKDKDINTEVNFIVIATKKKSQSVENSMKDVIIAIAYIKENSVLDDDELDFNKISYVADGKTSAKKKWGLF